MKGKTWSGTMSNIFIKDLLNFRITISYIWFEQLDLDGGWRSTDVYQAKI